jgi:hypothetical protein
MMIVNQEGVADFKHTARRECGIAVKSFGTDSHVAVIQLEQVATLMDRDV